MLPHPTIVVLGLGYVGLPLSVALARRFDVTGFDSDPTRLDELRNGVDRTREVGPEELAASGLKLADAPPAGADIYIVTVPTPVDKDNRPDLGAVLSATRTIAGLIDPKRRPTIVYESTVYPGVTEEICGPEIERIAGLKRGHDFRLGYSPERINPGDREHGIETITKVVAGEDAEVTDQLAEVYGAVNGGNVFRAASIKAAEAAKAIENAQRDINIAFMNEIATIVAEIGVSVWDVLDAARTKWNFLPFEPGLVGGHCIGVDPYYLSHLAQQLGHEPEVILSGRRINDLMGAKLADRLHKVRGGKPGKALVMGLTFKENVPDLRNSKVADLVERLEALGHEVDIADPLAGKEEIERLYGRPPVAASGGDYDLVVLAVPHAHYRALGEDSVTGLAAAGATIADIKGMWRGTALAERPGYWTL